MSIVKMKHLRVVAFDGDRRRLFRSLLKLGCVEISPPDDLLADPQWAALTQRGAEPGQTGQELQELGRAMKSLKDIAHTKKSLFAPRDQMGETSLLDGDGLEEAGALAREVNRLTGEMDRLDAEAGRLEARRAVYLPWEGLDLPLNTGGTDHCLVQLGTMPAALDPEEAARAVEEASPESSLQVVSSNREQHYLVLFCHRDAARDVLMVLKELGFSRVTFEGETTARERIADLDRQINAVRQEREALRAQVAGLGEKMPLLEHTYDALTVRAQEEETFYNLLHTQETCFFEGWTPVEKLGPVEEILKKYGCAYEFRDPQEGDDIPIQLKNSKIVAPVGMVTEMYSLPAYDGIDPNPLIFPFFSIFFGIMYADIGYGILLFLIGLLATKLMKPRGMVGQMMKLMIICGVTTTLAGACFGGFFGDVITVVSREFFGHEVTLPALVFNPLEEPMVMMGVSLALGGVQIIVGMLVKAYMLIRDGHPFDALFDVGSWFLLFAGLAVWVLQGSYWVAVAGVAALLLTQGRAKPTFIGKVVGGVASLYDITSYLSDILSYLRLMALVLATSVIASVVNTLGVMTGAVGFVLVFLIGHAFNMGVNIIGTYVHAARLQYLEFFGKFYKEGGRAFSPLKIRTKYVDVVKEEK